MNIFGKYPERRMRRMRRDEFSRRLMAESRLTSADSINPVLLLEGQNRIEPVPSLPGVRRQSLDHLFAEAERCVSLGIPAIALFPVISQQHKTPAAEEAYNPKGLVPTALRAL